MKIYKAIVFVLLIGWSLSNASAQNQAGDRINLESEAGMRKGTIFFAPETDLAFHQTAISSNEIFGSEIYTTWGTIEKNEGVYNWATIDNLIGRYKAVGKKVALRIATASFSINDSPDYLFSKYNIRRIVAGYWENFEKGDKGYIIHGTKTANAISGSYSLQMATEVALPVIETGATHNLNVQTGIMNPSFGPTKTVYPLYSPGFCAQFDFKANTATTFYAKAYSKSLGASSVIYKEWTSNAGETGSRTLEFFPLNSLSDYHVEIGIVKGDLTIDNINICDMKTAYYSGTLCFPNYLDTIFEQRYEVFIKALAAKYKDEETLNSICIGGYGRWEEMTISDDVEPNRFEDQWPTFGFTNDNYINHIKWCIDTYKKHFPTKKLFTGAVGWSTDYFRDQNLIEWQVGGYAARNGVSIKYNGWQSMCSEWGSEATAFFYLINRFKYEPTIWAMFEEGGQINNTLSEIMGHPISLFNRAILDGIDYYWVYSTDLGQTYFNRYEHYANEMAGSGLITKLYNYFGGYNYYSPWVKKDYLHKNIWMGIFQNDLQEGTKWTYTTINGQKAVQTNAANHRIYLSIDDRQKYNEMYGAIMTLDYLDQGTDNFKIYGVSPIGFMELATIKKTNSGTWKSVSLKDNGWGSAINNGGKDILNEIQIDDLSDGVETLQSIEINYVPGIEWQEQVVQSNLLVSGNTASLNSDYTFNVSVPDNPSISGIAVNVSPVSTGYVNIAATVTALVDGVTVSLSNKDFYMPQKEDWFYIPVGRVPDAESYKIVLHTDLGSATINLGADNKPAYRVYSFITEPGVQSGGNAEGVIEAMKPFSVLQVPGQANNKLSLFRKLPDGSKIKMAEIRVNESGVAVFEPQSAGRYELLNSGGLRLSAIPNYLKRLSVSKSPVRSIKGVLVKEFKGDSAFLVVSGLTACENDNLGFHALLSAENPELLLPDPMSLLSSTAHKFHLVIKNETNSSLSKVYWKTDKKDFCEENSMLIPIVPNDTEYREYIYPIGEESGWTDVITGLKFLPVCGHTDIGKIHIFAIGLRSGNTTPNAFGEKLEPLLTDFTVNAMLEISGLLLDGGTNFTEKSVIPVSYEFEGRLPTEYLISENADFAGAAWLPCSNNIEFAFSPNPGRRKVFFKVRDSLGEANTLSSEIIFKSPPEKLDASGKIHAMASVFPNPVNMKANVSVEYPDSSAFANPFEIYQVTILTLTGTVLGNSSQVGNTFSIDISEYPKGALMVKMVGNENSFTKIIIKQ